MGYPAGDTAFWRLPTDCRMTEFVLTQRDLAQRVGKVLTKANQTLRILDQAPDVLADVRTSEHRPVSHSFTPPVLSASKRQNSRRNGLEPS